MPTDPPDWHEENKDRAKNEFNRVSPDDSKSSDKSSQEDTDQGKGSPEDSELTYAQKQRQERDGSDCKTEQPDKRPRSYDEYYDEEKGRAKNDFNRASQKGQLKRDFNRASKPK